MKITRLRLTGFKSFVEPTELMVEPGLSGVVGPNGCGKSNLLEALRWVMGESSPKSMRGAGMEDVIFAGTNHRPMRNMAEVTIFLDNSDRTAPAQFNDSEALEVSRRIERDAGSVYRINGREVRQRDVQLLFADASTGAHSPALVRQGQIGQLINAKPIARRAILEEAAGMSGLHSRRHEAELRLRAAETNLTRLNDVLQELEGQLAQLKKQARQATRYKNLSGHIRRAEAIGLYLHWSEAARQVETAETELGAAQVATADATARAAGASKAQAEAQMRLPPLREAETQRAAAFQRLDHERQSLDREEQRARIEAERLAARLGQTRTDIERERARAADALSVIARLDEEEERIKTETAEAAVREDEARRNLDEASSTLAEGEAELDTRQGAAAALEANRKAWSDALSQARARLGKAEHEIAERRAESERLRDELAALPDVREARSRAEAARATAEAARLAMTQAEDKRAEASMVEAQRREALLPLERELEGRKAEAATLVKLIKAGKPDLFAPLIDAIKVAPGYEAALGAALGDDLAAPTDEAAPLHWRTLAAFETPEQLPEGAAPLSTFVEAPPALARRLGQIGVVTAQDGVRLQGKLKQGQRLVTIEGALWRWDGFTVSAEAPTAATLRLSQRNRLAELDLEIRRLDGEVAAARGELEEARRASTSALAAENEARAASRRADGAAVSAADALAAIERDATKHSTKLAAAFEALKQLSAAIADGETAAATAEAELEKLSGGEALAAQVTQARETVQTLRLRTSAARAEVEGLKIAAAAREKRLAALAAERSDWRARANSAERHMADLNARLEADEADLLALREVPVQLAEKRTTLLDMIAEAEQARADAADALAAAELELTDADKAVKAAANELSTARESRARAEAHRDAARERLAEIAHRIRETIGCQPTDLLARAEVREGEELPTLQQIEEKTERLKREREALGGVNLRADEEAQECQTRLDSMTAQKNDLEGAILKLRAGIASLNREGRERLLAAFATVNANFKRLFTTLFGGGEAQLTLTESDDPLEAGLEVLARPPGKKLQTISLLSGGEQALTALSLIFAVFLSNPAPICVLDEVDAPLDDANVERFCNLLDEMISVTETRFIIITHHALTMSRMHRLFGVTMAERGVSQLVSVDLQQAEQVLAAE